MPDGTGGISRVCNTGSLRRTPKTSHERAAMKKASEPANHVGSVAGGGQIVLTLAANTIRREGFVALRAAICNLQLAIFLSNSSPRSPHVFVFHPLHSEMTELAEVHVRCQGDWVCPSQRDVSTGSDQAQLALDPIWWAVSLSSDRALVFGREFVKSAASTRADGYICARRRGWR